MCTLLNRYPLIQSLNKEEFDIHHLNNILEFNVHVTPLFNIIKNRNFVYHLSLEETYRYIQNQCGNILLFYLFLCSVVDMLL